MLKRCVDLWTSTPNLCSQNSQITSQVMAHQPKLSRLDFSTLKRKEKLKYAPFPILSKRTCSSSSVYVTNISAQAPVSRSRHPPRELRPNPSLPSQLTFRLGSPTVLIHLWRSRLGSSWPQSVRWNMNKLWSWSERSRRMNLSSLQIRILKRQKRLLN